MIQNLMTKTGNPLRQVLETQKRYSYWALWLAFSIGLALILCGYKPAGKGLVLGTVFSVLNFMMMGFAMPIKIGRNKAQTLGINMSSLFVRLAVMAIPFFVALRTDAFSLGTTVAGVFLVQITILMDNIALPLLLSWFKKDRISGEL